jgi:alternate signal-mediated exported protein
MNKIIKGSIAGAAGIALLLGGAGTFALWNESTTVSASTITSGTMRLTATTGSWYNVTKSQAIADPTTFRVVPGDVLEYRTTLSVTATGDDLKATLSYDPAAAMASHAGVTVVLTDPATTSNVVRVGATNTFNVTPAAAVTTIPVAVRFAFSANGTAEQNTAITLSGVVFTLQQITP